MKELNEPPRWATRFLQWYCKEDLIEDLEGDLNEFYHRNLKNRSKRWADFIYIIDVLKFIRSYTVRIPQPHHAIPMTMILSKYFKASVRNMRHNMLFSGINAI
jgi:hypothetical protein